MMNLFSLLAFENLNPMQWKTLEPALNFLWKGLLAIFVVIGLIVLTVQATAKVINKVEEAKKEKQEQENQNNP